MDFEDSPQERAYRARAAAWLKQNVVLDDPADGTPVGEVTAERLRLARTWQARKVAAGYAAITYPKEYGGAGGTIVEELIFEEEEARFRVPRGVFEISLGNCVPTVMAFGDVETRRRYVPPAVRGEEIWCQLFSEPGAGSDLAGLWTRAARNEQGWLVNGQKVWTSGAHFADYGLLLARTDPTVPKHRGLTMFFVRMDTVGLESRPIRQLDGSSEFNEVFFSDVLIPDEQRLGDIGAGWSVAMATLGFERGAVGGGLRLLDHTGLLEVVEDVRIDGLSALETPRFEEQLVDTYVRSEGIRLNYLRAVTELSRDRVPGPEYAIGKLVSARSGQQSAQTALEMIGEAGLLDACELGERWRLAERSWTWGAALRIAGGSEEILKTLLAERVLGLPPEPRVDKGIPFNRLSEESTGKPK